MDDQTKNTVIVYSCIFDEIDDKRRAKQISFNDTNKSAFIPLDSRDFLTEVCNLNIPQVTFETYQKIGSVIYDYELLILIDTYLIKKIELSNLNDQNKIINNNSSNPYTYPESDLNSYNSYFDIIKELILPFKKNLYERLESEINTSNNNYLIPNLRTQCLLMPIKLSRSWTLIWVKFTKFSKYVEIFQISPLNVPDDKLCFKSQEFIKMIVADLLKLQDFDDLMFSFKYINKRINSDYSIDLITVKNIQSIIKGYQLYGFNVTPDLLPILLYDDTKNYVRHTRNRVLPLIDLSGVREFNLKNSKKKSKSRSNSYGISKNNDIRKKNILSSQINNYTSTSTPPVHVQSPSTYSSSLIPLSSPSSSKISSSSLSSSSLSSKHNYNQNSYNTTSNNQRNDKRNKSNVEDKLKIVLSPNKNTSQQHSVKIIVTLDNLENIKKTIDYDKEKMKELVDLYVQTYDKIEAFLLDKWSRVNLFSKTEISESQCPFLIYGPSQIEYEIIKEGGIIATNTLKQKIKKYNVTLTTRTMRYLTSSRRWINQRFKYNKKMKSVYYTRDPNLYIPDYRDAPYIVMATHLAFSCLPADETFEITHKNWYISRKMVAFIVARCEKCNKNHNH